MIQSLLLTPDVTLERDLRLDEEGEGYVYAWQLVDARGVECSERVDLELYGWILDRADDIDAWGGRQFVAGCLEEAAESRAVERFEAAREVWL